MEAASVRIKKGAGRSLKAGGSWIYDNEIDCITGECEDGDLVKVEDFDGYPLGQGFLNRKSTISIRMMTRKKGGNRGRLKWFVNQCFRKYGG